MSLRRSKPLPFSPKGASDALDSTNIFPGAMSALTNLIPDPTTKNLWQCRPAATQNANFNSAFTTPTFPFIVKIVGNRVYGFVTSADIVGHDEPFCYDLQLAAFVAVSGITNLNTPSSMASTGTWTPPTGDVIGTKLVCTHPGFNGTGGNFFGYFDISDPNNVSWSGANTTGAVVFTTAPTAVANFGGRAYYLINPPTGQPSMPASDVLAATVITNAGQVLTFGDNTPLTALAGLPLNNQLGGIIQSLMVFKDSTNIFQVTGDFAGSGSTAWAVNSLNVATGTSSPLSICTTPKGLAFVAPDGLRVIDFTARISDPVGINGMGINNPFVNAVVPSRIVGACNGNVLRMTVQNGSAVGNPQQEYWYDIGRQTWSGPHTSAAWSIKPYGNLFIMTLYGVNAKMFQSESQQSNTSTFVENGTQLTYSWKTCPLPDTMQMSENAMIETTINMALTSGAPVTVTAVNQDDTILNTVTITASGSATIWGGFQWGQAVWLGASNNLYPRQCQWTTPVVFRRLYINATGNCASGIKIGDMFMKYEQLGYLQQAS
jgi:hypothetical protein